MNDKMIFRSKRHLLSDIERLERGIALMKEDAVRQEKQYDRLLSKCADLTQESKQQKDKIDLLEQQLSAAIKASHFLGTVDYVAGNGYTYQTDYYHNLDELIEVVTTANDVGQQIVVTTGKGVIPDNILRELGTTVQVRYV